MEEKKDEFDEHVTAIDYGYNFDIQLYNSNYEDKIVQVNPDTVTSKDFMYFSSSFL